MKKIIICLAGIIAIAAAVFLAFPKTEQKQEILRIHIRADSNNLEDQQIKLVVKDRIVQYLTPFLVECKTKEEAVLRVQKELKNIECISNQILTQNKFVYTAHAKVISEEFPTRVYGEQTFEQGIYDALIVNLGSGNGDNWWCVVYPPLCFVGKENPDGEFRYVSKLLEIIDLWTRKSN